MKSLIRASLVLILLLLSKTAFAYNSYCSIGQTPPGYKTFFHQANWSIFDFTDPEVINYVYVYTELTEPVYATAFTWYEAIHSGGVETHYYKNPPNGSAEGSGWIEIDSNFASCWVSGTINNTPPVSVWLTPSSAVTAGSTATVNWSSSGASSCTYNGGNPMPGGALTGNYSFTATDDATYTVSCAGPLGEDNYGPLGGIGQASATLTVLCTHHGLPQSGSLSKDSSLPDSGTGYYHFLGSDPVNTDDWACTDWAISKVQAAGAWWNQTPRIGIGDLSLSGGGNFPPHAAHQNGLDVDVRYVRNNSTEGPVDFDGATATLYDQTKTQQIVSQFCTLGAVNIFVDQRASLTGSCVQNLSGHNNHIHVRFPDPDGTGN